MVVNEENNEYLGLSTSTFLVGMISGVLTYFLFGVLDYFALPLNYVLAWKIRAIALGFGLLTGLLMTNRYPILRNKELYLVTLLLGGAVGILVIIGVADENEVAYWVYYAGLIVMNLFAGFVYRLSVKSIYILAGVAFFGYNIVALGFQNLYLDVENHAMFIANEFFLLASSVLAVFGAYQFRMYKSKVWEQHQIIKEESRLHLVAKKKAEETDRLKTAFLANMSHEIRTPLNAIVGFSHMVGDTDLEEEERDSYMSIIDNNADQLVNIISDIVDIAKIEGDQMQISYEDVNVNDCIRNCEQNARLILEQQKPNVELFSILSEQELTVRADGFRMAQVFNNLLGNAVKFTQQGYIEFGFERIDTDKVVLFVKDTGIGIDAAGQEKVFKEFTQEDETIATRFGGTGLGLTITKRLLNLMDGDILIDSEKDVGTVIRFTLPLSNKPD